MIILPLLVTLIGNIYIADSSNNRIRKVTVSTGIITTIAGKGTTTYDGDGGAATSASIYEPYGVSVDSSGNVYIADCYHNRIRKVTVTGTFGPTATPRYCLLCTLFSLLLLTYLLC